MLDRIKLQPLFGPETFPYVFNKCFLRRALTNLKQLKAYNIEAGIKQVYRKRKDIYIWIQRYLKRRSFHKRVLSAQWVINSLRKHLLSFRVSSTVLAIMLGPGSAKQKAIYKWRARRNWQEPPWFQQAPDHGQEADNISLGFYPREARLAGIQNMRVQQRWKTRRGGGETMEQWTSKWRKHW